MDHITQDEFVYAHKWNDGDLTIWDNRAVLHRGRPWDGTKYKRILRPHDRRWRRSYHLTFDMHRRISDALKEDGRF